MITPDVVQLIAADRAATAVAALRTLLRSGRPPHLAAHDPYTWRGSAGGRIEVAESVTEVEGRQVVGPPESHASQWVPVPRLLREGLSS